MKLFIRIKNGQPFEHPIFEDNFRDAFPNVDTNNLPPEFAEFVRVEAPRLNPYEKNQTVSYQLVDGVYTDVFSCEQMSAEEIDAKQQTVKNAWVAANLGYNSWNFSDALCEYVPPVPKPEDGNSYVWRESDMTWVLLPAAPSGDGWTFNAETGNWVKI